MKTNVTKGACIRSERMPKAAFPNVRFSVGELYLFHETDPRCPQQSSLWGIFDRTDSRGLRLESATKDLLRFEHPCRLPAAYRYCRRATRAELRDYIYNLACEEYGGPYIPGH